MTKRVPNHTAKGSLDKLVKTQEAIIAELVKDQRWQDLQSAIDRLEIIHDLNAIPGVNSEEDYRELGIEDPNPSEDKIFTTRLDKLMSEFNDHHDRLLKRGYNEGICIEQYLIILHLEGYCVF